MSVDYELWKAVSQLNAEGGFLQVERIAEAARGLPWSAVKKALDSCVENRDYILDHTHFLCSELGKARQDPNLAQEVQAPGGQGALARAEPQQGEYSAQETELWNRIAWMNTEGGFECSIRYEDVAMSAQGLDLPAVLLVLSHLEDKWQEVNDPTSWVCAALHKKRGGGKGFKGQQAPSAEADAGIRERVAWLNAEGGLLDVLRPEEVSAAACGVDPATALQMLELLLAQKAEIGDPTAWVCAALKQQQSCQGAAGKGWTGAWTQQSWSAWQSSCPPELDRELRRRIAFLNNEGGFQNSITYREIAEAAAGLTLDSVMKVFANLEEKREEVTNPTSWVCAALWKERGCGGKAAGKAEAQAPSARACGKGAGGLPPPPPPPVQKTIAK